MSGRMTGVLSACNALLSGSLGDDESKTGKWAGSSEDGCMDGARWLGAWTS